MAEGKRCKRCHCPLAKVLARGACCGKWVELTPGQGLVGQGECLAGLYIVCRGGVRCVRVTRHGRTQILLPWLSRGWVLGRLDAGGDGPWPYGVQAVGTSAVTYVAAAEARRVLATCPESALALLRQQARLEAALFQRLSDCLGRPARERLILTLLHAQEVAREPGCVRLTNRELADLTGNTPVTVSQQLGWLKAQRAVWRVAGRLRFDRAALQRLLDD